MPLRQIDRSDLERSNFNIVEMEKRIDAQRALIDKARLSGRDPIESRKALGIMLESLQAAKDLRRQLIRELAGVEGLPWTNQDDT
jgi:hypothetical protein